MKKESYDSFLINEVQQLLKDKAIGTLKDSEDFIAFLHYCVQRLDKGEPVQVIWNDFQGRAG
jgi:hypothetical protein